MFDIFAQSHFSSGHHLRDYPGNCEKPHGHNWKVKATMRVKELDRLGLGLDFRVLKQALKKIVDELDHCDLNSHPAFKDKNPSSENIAKYIFDQLDKLLANENCHTRKVSVKETDSCGVCYYGNREGRGA